MGNMIELGRERYGNLGTARDMSEVGKAEAKGIWEKDSQMDWHLQGIPV